MRHFTRLRLVKYLAISHADSCNKSYTFTAVSHAQTNIFAPNSAQVIFGSFAPYISSSYLSSFQKYSYFKKGSFHLIIREYGSTLYVGLSRFLHRANTNHFCCNSLAGKHFRPKFETKKLQIILNIPLIDLFLVAVTISEVFTQNVHNNYHHNQPYGKWSVCGEY